MRVGDTVGDRQARRLACTTNKVTKLYTFDGLKRVDVRSAPCGEIVALAGFEGITIGETITSAEKPAPLPALHIDEPTLSMIFSVNTSPFAGREGKWVTSRNIKDRLEKELLTNVSIRVEPTDSADSFKVMGRGELQLAILIETMRREGFELSVSNPEVITRTEDGVRKEPLELFVLDVPETYMGVVLEKMAMRKGKMVQDGEPRLRPRAPRLPRAHARPHRHPHRAHDRHPRHRGHEQPASRASSSGRARSPRRPTGVLVADRTGETTAYTLNHMEERGELFIGPGTVGLRGHDRGRERAPRGHGRQHHQGEEADQHARLDRRRGDPPDARTAC